MKTNQHQCKVNIVDTYLIIFDDFKIAPGEKGGERRASSHELRAAKEGGGRSEPKEKELVGHGPLTSSSPSSSSSLSSSSIIITHHHYVQGRVGELVRKVQSEVNVKKNDD